MSNDLVAMKRLEALFDPQSFHELGSLVCEGDAPCPVITGWGLVDGMTVYAFSQNKEALSGALTPAHARKLVHLLDMAEKTGCPVVGIYDSLGGDIKKNNETLSAYGKLLGRVNRLSGVVPQISLVLGTCAGSAAMMAASADLLIMSPEAELFVNGAFRLKAAGQCGEASGKAETADGAGIAHLVGADEQDAIAKARRVLGLLPENNLAPAPIFEFAEPAAVAATGLDAMGLIGALADADSAVELQAGFGKGAVVALATMGGQSVGFVANQYEANKGRLTADVCVKIARFVRLCDSYSIPVVTLVNSAGFDLTDAIELGGGVRQAAMLANTYAEATCPKVSVVVGKAVGPAFLALASKECAADLAYAWPDATISAICCKTAGAILYEGPDAKANAEQYKAEYAAAKVAAEGDYIDGILTPEDTRAALIAALDLLAGKRVSKLAKKQTNIQI